MSTHHLGHERSTGRHRWRITLNSASIGPLPVFIESQGGLTIFRTTPPMFSPAITFLPAELLLEVFKCCKDAEEMETGRQTRWWIRLTHVCKYWRHLALHAPGLWNAFECTNVGWTRAALERSMNLPLHVHVYFAGKGGLLSSLGLQSDSKIMRKDRSDAVVFTSLALVFEKSNRLQSLTISGDIGRGLPDSNPLYSYSCVSVPALKQLHISSNFGDAVLSMIDLSSLTQLQSITARTTLNSRLSSSLISQESLTLLTLGTPPQHGLVPGNGLSSFLPATETLRLLETTGSLEYLDLWNISSVDSTPSAGIAKPIKSFPRLRRLRLSGSMESCTYFLTALDIPTSAAIHLHIASSDNSSLPHPSSALASYLTTHFLPAHDRPALRSLMYDNGLFEAWSEPLSLNDLCRIRDYSCRSTTKLPHPTLSIRFPSRGASASRDVFLALVSSLPLEKVQTAFLYPGRHRAGASGGDSDPYWEAPLWCGIFKKLPEVKNLSVRLKYNKAQPFLAALLPHASIGSCCSAVQEGSQATDNSHHQSHHPQVRGVHLPALESLDIFGADDLEVRSGMTRTTPSLTYRHVFGLRKEAKYQLKRLCMFMHYRPRPSDFSQLRRFVGELVVV